ncbi:hypothetical protein [Methylobacterium dankookense]|uniref:Uncharacterized protein n=1 Tax=Methylobacterium dankookense TaxID=560405 RepID=A0A564FVR4_9HYPH|nr:hypothetical protein [Methylobacterium dankookense]GJD56196.1 hypothetical protein IFDJLNFL_2091 [Methylobacterium dankookense]VUF11770.1 hypothetical protein MTDSW087_01454 [Methylobacterium dankookense]
MPKPVLEDRPIWPVVPAEAPREVAQDEPDTNEAPSRDEAAPEIRISADSFEGFGSFSS